MHVKWLRFLLIFPQIPCSLTLHLVHWSSLEPFQNPYPFLVLHLGLDKSLVLSSLPIRSLTHPESCEVFNTSNAVPRQGWMGKGRHQTRPHYWRWSHLDDLLEGKKEQDQVGKWAVEQDSREKISREAFSWMKTWSRQTSETCGVLATQINSTSTGCWLLNGKIQIIEEMTVHSKQNCAHLDRLRK